jgi:hypothetical protein
VFQKGNQLAKGKGRPKNSAVQPDLPPFFAATNINWVGEFRKLYKLLSERPLTDLEKGQLKFFMEIMPYLCPKERTGSTGKKEKTAPPSQDERKTSLLLQALERENARSIITS